MYREKIKYGYWAIMSKTEERILMEEYEKRKILTNVAILIPSLIITWGE